MSEAKTKMCAWCGGDVLAYRDSSIQWTIYCCTGCGARLRSAAPLAEVCIDMKASDFGREDRSGAHAARDMHAPMRAPKPENSTFLRDDDVKLMEAC